MVGVPEISSVEHPHVTDVEDLVVGASEELLEVLARLEKIREPNQGRKVALPALKVSASETHLLRILLIGCLYRNKEVHHYWS